MVIVKKVISAGMDGDSSLKLVDNKCAINIQNARNSVSERGRVGRLESLMGTSLMAQTVHPTGTNICIGSVPDIKRNRLIYFLHNSLGTHGIFAFDFATSTTYRVLSNTQVTGGLSFSKTYRIDRNAKVIGDLLVFTDSLNEPRCINIEAGIKLNDGTYDTDVEAYATPIPYTTITLIKRPPIYPLVALKDTDGSYDNNYVENNAYQFTYRYWYKNYNYSALAAYSELIPYSAPEETNNYVLVQLSFSEQIDDYIQQIDICVKYGNTGKTFIVKSFNKDNTEDAAAIALHNASTTQLAYSFYDNIIGVPLDDADANSSFDNVALLAETVEIAKSRVFLGDVLKGYDTPATSSLSATLATTDTGASGDYAGEWGFVTLNANLDGACQDEFMYPFVHIATGATHIFYYFSSVRSSTIWNGGLGTVPSTININDAVFSGDTEASLIAYLKVTQYPFGFGGCGVLFPTWQTPYDIDYAAFGSSTDVTVYDYVPVSVNQFFKSSSDYEINVEFKDQFARKCGLQRNGVVLSIPARTYTQTEFTSAIQWTLSNTDALAEIPSWAYYYQIVIKKNQTTRFFSQVRTAGVQYATKEQDDTYTYSNTFTSATNYATAIDITALTAIGMGYTFTEGDFARVITSSDATYNLSILGTDGNYVFVSLTDLGTGSSSVPLLTELYTPYRPTLSEPSFETGDVYPVANPTTTGRAYSTTTDIITGDTFAIQRTDAAAADYIAEAMSPNDKLWRTWETDTGFVNYVSTIGQVRKDSTLDYSDTYLNGTKTNGINKFGALNSKDLGSSSGSIQKLQLADKVQEQGSVMLAICSAGETHSLYLGEAQVVGASSNAFLAVSLEVVGSDNPLKGSRGTINPESVIQYKGLVFWVDAINGEIVQYSGNGLDVVSKYKMDRFFKRYLKNYQSASNGNIDNINGFHHLPTAIDPFSKEFIVTCVGLIYQNYATNLPSYSSVPSYASSILNRFDIYDELAKSMSLSFEENIWGNNCEYVGEWFDYLSNTMIGFKNGSLYKHSTDATNWNRFYGSDKAMRICVTLNEAFSADMELCNIAVEASHAPTFVVAYSGNPNIQISDLTADDFKKQGTVFYSNFLRDRLDPNQLGTADQKLYKGSPIVGYPLQIMLEWDINDEMVYIDAIDLGFEVATGTKQIIQK